MKKNVILSSLSLLVAISLATYSIYAWFIFGATEFTNVIFTSGNISLASHFWLIQDNNRDGYYDYDDLGKVNLIDTKNMLTQEENIAAPQLAIEGDIFSYRFLIQSTSDIPVALTFRLDNLVSPIHDVITWNYSGYTRYRSLLFSDVGLVTDFTNLDDPTEFSKTSVVKTPSKIYRSTNVLTPSQEYIMQPQDIFVFDFQIKFERLEWLQSNSPTIFHPGVNLEAYSNATFNKTTLYIEFVSLSN